MRWTVQHLAQALTSPMPAGVDAAVLVNGVSIDSRTLVPGNLFIAIRGPHHDGHNFVATAIETGAVVALVAHDRIQSYPPAIRAKLLAVPDTLVALQDLARAVRRDWGKQLAAVTGSVGKTTTKEILAALLGARFRVLKSEGNLNNEFGLPLALLRLEPDFEAAVVELGMSHRGELRRLAEIAEPQVGVVTRVAPVHLEFFSSVDEIALAKRELIEGLRGSDSVAVLNADDSRVMAFARVAPGRVVTYGFAPSAQFRAENIEDRGADGSVFDFVSPRQTVRLPLPFPGRHNVSNALAALAAASEWGITAEDAAAVFPQLMPGELRGRLRRFVEGFSVINDSYNSNPVALQAMTELLSRTPGYRRRILAAGQMLELGPQSAQLHHECGRQAASLKIDLLVAVAGDAAQMAQGAVEAGLSSERVRFFETATDAGAFLAQTVEAGDLVLIKGSRGVKMERIFEALRARYVLAQEPAGLPSATRGPR